MGKVTGFLEIDRLAPRYEPASDRIRHYREFTRQISSTDLKLQASRCMDCGVPYCHTYCPVNNQIPDWNDLVYYDDWKAACDNLHSTNNFPEFTGRTCPAPCEAACTLNLEDVPVTIKSIEDAITSRGWKEGWIVPRPASHHTGKSVGIIGSGPAGLAAAQQLVRAGHMVHVYEREPRAGGLLRYGIPDFKMEKHLIDRRIEQMQAEGVHFHLQNHVGENIGFEDIRGRHDALLIAAGAENPRDPGVPHKDIEGIHNAMPYLVQQNRRNNGEAVIPETYISAQDKHVVIIGGGDTASDCIGTAFRQGALSVTQLDIRPEPPEVEDKLSTWPEWPVRMRISTSQEEGAKREFFTGTLAFTEKNGRLTAVKCARVDRERKPIEGTEFEIPAQLALIAIGFSGAAHSPLFEELSPFLSPRRTLKADEQNYRLDNRGVFAAGDVRRGQSLVVWAIREGRQAARAIDMFLMGESVLPR